MFEKSIEVMGVDFSGVGAVAVAVSGGADSMALLGLVRSWSENYELDVHVLSVDHGLRVEAADEIAMVTEHIADWPRFFHTVLNWDAPASSAIQEKARKARYALMAQYCDTHSIAYLFLGHHQDDQAETVLFRLAKGSGLDGLCGMQSVQHYDENLELIRPLLGVSKENLVVYCQAQNIPFEDDPSNDDVAYARVRLRAARAVLEREGLSAKRLSVTASRLLRARKALDVLALDAYKNSVNIIDTNRIVFNLNVLKNCPEELILRALLIALDGLRIDQDYLPRMEKIEDILSDLLGNASFRKRTLGGVIFERDNASEQFILSLEHQL